MTTLIHQTDKHDWYTIRFKEHWARVHSLLFNIVPKGDKPPTNGYYQPRIPMDKNGYHNLKVRGTFIKPQCN